MMPANSAVGIVGTGDVVSSSKVIFGGFGVYSAACVNCEPTRVTFHPILQQKTSLDGHVQCIWNNQYPTPDLDQSSGHACRSGHVKYCDTLLYVTHDGGL
jgi:hypothetical protein